MSDNNQLLSQVRRLSQGLLASVALNIALLALLFYWLVKETPPRPYIEQKPANEEEQQAPLAIDRSNGDIIRNFRTLPMEQLIAKLSNTQLVDNGYTQRDLALAALIAFHHFDLSRALLGHAQPAQQRRISFGKNREGNPVEVTVFPGLTEQQFQAIIQFANTERWPVTSRGLFLLLRRQGGKTDPSLADTFFLTPEFLAIETLFNRADVSVEKSEILKVLCQGSWKMITTFVEQQRAVQDLSPARRQRFLLDYIDHESRAAAYLLLKTDGVFAARKLNDNHILAILNLLVEKTPEAEQFALIQLTSPRSDAVWQLSASRLYQFSGEPIPETDIIHAALYRFVQKPEQAPVAQLTPSPSPAKAKPPAPQTTAQMNRSSAPSITARPTFAKAPSPQTNRSNAPKASPRPSYPYVIQEGDSLWKISKRFKIDIDTLKEYNKLQSDFLKPGTTLRIPPPENKRK